MPSRPAAPRRLRPAERERLGAVTTALLAAYPDADCALSHEAPHELLVATILSAQCTDERVNMVTPALFDRFPTTAALAAAPLPELERLIHSTGFFRNKAKNLQGAMRGVVERFGGAVPRTMEDLLTLPGVARKTANVVLGTAFGIADGIVVDTHVTRLANRLGYTRQQDPVKIERDLVDVVPRESWIAFSHTLILHGRQVCDARKPACERCVVRALCPSALPDGALARPVKKATAKVAKKAAKQAATAPSSPRRRRATAKSSSRTRGR